jgi:hypothetical protein
MGMISELESRSKRSMMINGRGTLYVCDVTPDLAKLLMAARDQKQRRVSKSSLARYTRHMRGGTWDWTGVPIVLNAAGVLIDGQHRCHAVASAGATMEDAIVIVLASSVSTLDHPSDIGKVRVASDYRSRPMRNGMAAAIVFEHYGCPSSMNYITDTDQRDRGALQSGTPYYDQLTKLDNACGVKRGRSVSTGVGAGFIRVLKASGDDAMPWLMAVVTNGAIDGIIESTAELVSYISLRRDIGAHPQQAAAVVVRAWNSYVIGRVITKVANTDGPVPDAMALRRR